MRLPIFVACASLILCFTAPSFADTSGQDEAIAEQLFDEGLAFEKKGDWKSACPKYEASQRISPANGTLLKLGICHSQIGLTATGYGELILARTRAKKDGRADRVALADEWLTKLEPHLSKVLVSFASVGDASVATVSIDGKPIDKGIVGTAFPIDPGKHSIEVNAPGKRAWATELHVGADADKPSINIPTLENAPVADKIAPAPEIGVQPRDDGKRTAGWVLGATGIAVAGVGAYFTLHAISLRKDAENLNSTDPGAANSTNDDARRALTFGRIGIGVGIVAFGAGAYLLVTSHADESNSKNVAVAPWIATGSGGVSIEGAW